MAVDEERQTAATEHTPLLGESTDAGAIRDVAGEDGEDGNTPKQGAVSEPKTRSWYAWRAFWTLLGAGVLFLFIKGWVDAGGDVDVSFCFLFFLFLSFFFFLSFFLFLPSSLFLSLSLLSFSFYLLTLYF